MVFHDLNILNYKTHEKGGDIFYLCILKHDIMLGIISHFQLSIYYFKLANIQILRHLKYAKIFIFQNSGTMPKLVPLQS